MTIIPVVIVCTVTKGLLKGLEDLEVGGRVETIWPYSIMLSILAVFNNAVVCNSIIENGQNTEKSPGDLRRLAVTQFLVKDHQLTLM